MLKILRSVWDFFLFTHIYLALGAASQVYLTYSLFKVPVSFPIVIIIFLSTYSTYNFSMVNFRWRGMRSDGSARQNLISRFYFPIKVSIVAAGFLILILNLFISPLILPILMGEAALSFFYSFSWVNQKGKKINLRQIPLIKNVIISTLWAISVVLIPLLNHLGTSIFQFPSFFFVLFRSFFLILIISIAFDIRDIETDLSKNTYTLTSLLGRENSKILVFILSLFMILYLFLTREFMKSTVYWALTISSLLLTLFISWIHPKKSDYFYMTFLDGIILIQYPLVLLIQKVWCLI